MKRVDDRIVFSPSDLNLYLASPFASWMARFDLEFPGTFEPDELTDDERLIMETGNKHELDVLSELRVLGPVVEIPRGNFSAAIDLTQDAIDARESIIYQAALRDAAFEGFADFLILNTDGSYEVWDTKLARSPKPYYAIQLCCYSEMLGATSGAALPQKFGIILGSRERVEFRTEDFVHYYRRVRRNFQTMQEAFDGNPDHRPEPLARANHYQWTTLADRYLDERDHMVRVAGITTGQIKKLRAVGIDTLTKLSASSGANIPKLAADTLEKLAQQALLQHETRTARQIDPDAKAAIRVLAPAGKPEPVGLAALPPPNPGDVFFDMEGYPLVPGGLEYLFGACYWDNGELKFIDRWAHDRAEEKLAFEGFVDWVFDRWCTNRGMHIYHYASYEKTALRRLSTFHNTRQDEVDELLRGEVLVDLYPLVTQGLRIGEESYSIKKVELQYRSRRGGDVASAVESVVQYARWMESGEPGDWRNSTILNDIRDYNRDDCESTAQLRDWLIKLADENGIARCTSPRATKSAAPYERKDLPPDVLERLAIAERLREKAVKEEYPVAATLSDLIDFHRREDKPMWWRLFDRVTMTDEELRDDNGCIANLELSGEALPDKQSLIQGYTFDPAQECKLAAGEKSRVMFTENIDAKLTLYELDGPGGHARLRVGRKTLASAFNEQFPIKGSLIPDEAVPAGAIQKALTEVAEKHLSDELPASTRSLLERTSPMPEVQLENETTVDTAIRIAEQMNGGCLVIQGPPGTGKSYTAANMIVALVRAGKTIGVASNSHKAIDNLLGQACAVAKAGGSAITCMKVAGDGESSLLQEHPEVAWLPTNPDADDNFGSGVIGGTAWLFSREAWIEKLDYLFIDEAGQVSLANAVAISRSARNLVLLGDQMQLEQPIQGSHPGDSGTSVLQYALKDTGASKPDMPVFHAVVPPNYGLFLGESRRMHPEVCTFISESIYEGRLGAHIDCSKQRIELPLGGGTLITRECGILFSPVEHDGNIQRSDEEVDRVVTIYEELVGRRFTASDGSQKALELDDFLFISPYNAQVRALHARLPAGAQVGSVDKFQGQQAPVCILSLCSSCGEYGSRGLRFILDQNRINVAISRAKCLAVVVGDPRIAGDNASSIETMRLLNLFCKLVG
jgi:predicted RecB family nuclease